MNSYHLCIATADKLKFSDIHPVEHHLFYAFDITFEKPSTPILPNMTAIRAGSDRDFAEDFLSAVKKYFESAGISEDSPVSILFSGNQILAIGPRERDLWIDVRRGIFTHIHPHSFQVLGIDIKSLEVY